MMNLEYCHQRGLIKKASISDEIIKKEFKMAMEFVNESEKVYNAQIYRSALAAAYYTMSHMARAILYKKGYTERSHACLFLSLIEIVDDEDIEVALTISNEFRKMREAAQYEGKTVLQEEAKVALREAKDFVELVKSKEILNM